MTDEAVQKFEFLGLFFDTREKSQSLAKIPAIALQTIHPLVSEKAQEHRRQAAGQTIGRLQCPVHAQAGISNDCSMPRRHATPLQAPAS
ncbi:hypothetical protein ADU59_26655 [Pararhizobium polonicum]|uniref:Uncharacterized protein n=1 Tax=Pararhizobium polonicum TaxID=1612624 RepID=A0A1C7NTK7_9HYPH|nr:hypothetical protein [Pararhizobium polonicum]OBZ92333.1 hypothetical protein ADU59_26655 [Pararhizobium polonicum]